jgi:hypothetical protein
MAIIVGMCKNLLEIALENERSYANFQQRKHQTQSEFESFDSSFVSNGKILLSLLSQKTFS